MTKTDQSIGRWTNIGKLFADINTVAQKLENHTMAEKDARTMATLFRCGAGSISLMLKHAELTGRLKKNSGTLPNFTIGQAN